MLVIVIHLLINESDVTQLMYATIQFAEKLHIFYICHVDKVVPYQTLI